MNAEAKDAGATDARPANRGLPLLAAQGGLARTVAWRGGEPVSAAQFLADAQAQAAVLPAACAVVNLCADRYRFAVGLAAALLRGQTSLLPPNALPGTLARLGGGRPALYGLTDDAAPGALPGLPLLPAFEGGARPDAQAELPLIDASRTAACLLTSGSTGVPQPHAKSWRTLVLNIAAAAERLASVLERPSLAGLNLVATVPAQHSYGFESTVLLALLGGAAFESSRPFYPADIAAALARLPRPRALVTTPFHLKTLLAAGVVLPPADLLLCATAPLSPQLALAAERAFGAPLVEIYGCTEAGQVATRRTVAGELWQTFGALRVRREGGGGQDERHVVSGGHVAEPTPLADVLELDAAADGRRFRLLGRAGDVIHVAGKRSSLAHLNFQLNSIEGVQDGAFWLPPDVADGIVRPVAFVVAPGLDAAAIAAALRARLEPVFVPRKVLLVDALPREATGKLGAEALERYARAHLVAAASRPDVEAACRSVGEAAPRSVGEADTRAVGAAGAEDAAASRTLLRDIAADHPAFAGHFPGRPLLPGVLLLAEVLEAVLAVPALAARLGPRPVLSAAKFLAPVGPGTRIEIAVHAAPRGLRFEVRRAGRLASSGQWQAAAA